MKKSILALAVLAMSMGLSAQHVSPLNIELAQFSLDSMRTQYANNLAMYKSELQRIQDVQDANKKSLSDAAKELKDEKIHAKDVAAYLKQKESTYTALQKLYNSEQDKLCDMRETIEKQTTRIQKTTRLTSETRDNNRKELETEKSNIERSIKEVEGRLKSIAKIIEKLPDEQEALAAFNLEIQNKETDLKQLQATQKTNVSTIKAELKTVKAAIKGK